MVFLIFFDPGKDGTVAQAGGDLFLKGIGVHAGKFQEVLVERAVVGVFAVLAGQGGPALVQHPRENYVTPEPHPGTPGGVDG